MVDLLLRNDVLVVSIINQLLRFIVMIICNLIILSSCGILLNITALVVDYFVVEPFDRIVVIFETLILRYVHFTFVHVLCYFFIDCQLFPLWHLFFAEFHRSEIARFYVLGKPSFLVKVKR